MLRATDRIDDRRQRMPVAEQLASGRAVTYPTYLMWRGLLDREPPRRPEPDRVSGPAAARNMAWKFATVREAVAVSVVSFIFRPPGCVRTAGRSTG